MATAPLRSVTPAIDVYIKLAQYPILADEIRVRMREELFRRGVVSQSDFERELRQMALDSQRREGWLAPYGREEESTWHKRLERIRDFHTDAYFADNLGVGLLEQIIAEVFSNHSSSKRSIQLTFNPELAPWEVIFRQGEIYEAMPAPERAAYNHHLEELKVVLIKRMISDQLPFIGVARKVLSIADLRWIYRRLIGGGKIGGKAAGMVLAWRILQQTDPEFGPDISHLIEIPDSYFIGSEIIYEFNLMNRLDRMMNQKYRPLPEMRAEYPRIIEAYLRGSFPESILDQLREVIGQVGRSPFIARSSSLLEDSFSYSFAGKYGSYFCPNQGSDDENFRQLLDGIRRVYASTFNPEAILARQAYGLIDYDERMAVLLQRLQGKRYGRYYLPAVSGVGISQNPFCWNDDMRPEDGFLRLVWGFGSQAEDESGRANTRTVGLSHPMLRPETTAEAIRQSSQRLVDVIDLQDNSFKTVPVAEVLQRDYPYLRYIASVDRGETLAEIRSEKNVGPEDHFVLTFDTLIKDRKFIKLMRTALMRLEKAYETPISIEFAVDILPGPSPDYRLHILQCRPLCEDWVEKERP